MSKLQVSFVLPVYNGQANIAQCIESLLVQKDRSEIIVIDDGCTDNTARILAHYQTDIIIFSNEERKGAAYCRNLGNKHAVGDIVAVCDCDYYFPERSEIITTFFNKYKSYDLLYTACNVREKSATYRMPALEWDLNSKCPIAHPTVAYRNEIAKKFKYHEVIKDTDLYEFFLLDIGRAGHKLGWCNDSTCLKFEEGRKRNKEVADVLKKQWYEMYDIKIN